MFQNYAELSIIPIQLVEKQYSELHFVLKKFYPLTLNDSQGVTVSFDPDDIAGWKRTSDGEYEVKKVLNLLSSLYLNDRYQNRMPTILK